MAKQKYIVDMQALYDCLQFLPRVRVDGIDMVSIEDVLNFLDHFPKTPTNVVLNVVLDEDPFETPEPLEHPCDSCKVGWGRADTTGYKSCQDECEKLAEFWKKAEV